MRPADGFRRGDNQYRIRCYGGEVHSLDTREEFLKHAPMVAGVCTFDMRDAFGKRLLWSPKFNLWFEGARTDAFASNRDEKAPPPEWKLEAYVGSDRPPAFIDEAFVEIEAALAEVIAPSR